MDGALTTQDTIRSHCFSIADKSHLLRGLPRRSELFCSLPQTGLFNSILNAAAVAVSDTDFVFAAHMTAHMENAPVTQIVKS
jgi:hypothetical protein